mmetsp:Transcript_50919/g.124058  ORF Transcript_50919/g.124058 Transcript_50919/m.124058 type:complete len:218 (-) Transcript_50919:2739-3392(-)
MPHPMRKSFIVSDLVDGSLPRRSNTCSACRRSACSGSEAIRISNSPSQLIAAPRSAPPGVHARSKRGRSSLSLSAGSLIAGGSSEALALASLLSISLSPNVSSTPNRLSSPSSSSSATPFQPCPFRPARYGVPLVVSPLISRARGLKPLLPIGSAGGRAMRPLFSFHPAFSKCRPGPTPAAGDSTSTGSCVVGTLQMLARLVGVGFASPFPSARGVP